MVLLLRLPLRKTPRRCAVDNKRERERERGRIQKNGQERMVKMKEHDPAEEKKKKKMMMVKKADKGRRCAARVLAG
jgi:hypothetical protein